MNTTDHKWAIRWEEEPRKGWWLCKQVDNQVVSKECWIGEEASLAADRLVAWMNQHVVD